MALLAGPVLGAQAQSSGPLAVEDRTLGGQAPSAITQGGNNDEGLFMLMQQMQQYEQQIQNLQGQVEELRHELDQVKGAERDRYLDLDTRINALVDELRDEAETDADAGDGGSDDGESENDPEADREAYSEARGHLLERDFDAAASAFETYLDEFPNGEYRAHAHFWLGQVYTDQDDPQLDKAREQFGIVADDYPDHSRAPTSLYKLASMQARDGDTSEAKVSLHKLIKQYPDSSEAEMAEATLERLESD